MEKENNNNAVEKAENIANKNEQVREQKVQAQNSDAVHSNDANLQNSEHRTNFHKNKEERERLREEREHIYAQKRLETARLKAHRKAERQKARATAIREKNRRRAELERQRLELKAQKQARREMLKSETQKERALRQAEEKRARREQKAQIMQQRQERHQRIMEEKRIKREHKSATRQKNRDKNRGYGGWLAAVISLGIATLVLSSVLTFTFLMPTESDNMLESTYQKSFYDTVEQVDNIDLNLSKALATSDKGALQKYLVDTAINSELAENDLQQLPLQDESKHYTTKLINQIGDYAKYLNNKIINGENLTEQDKETLARLYRANAEFKKSLQKMVGEMGNDFSFATLMDGGSGNLVINGFNDLQNMSVQYPELIYDGPFSDGINEREIKGLTGEAIDENTAKEIFIKIFDDYSLQNVKNVGVLDGNMECFNVQGEKDGDILFAQISKKGGKLIMFSYAGSCEKVNCDKMEAQEIAEQFVAELGLETMKSVWINLSNNVYTINLASTEGEAIVYSDLVKVRVCAETKMVIGFEATGYYTNHTERNFNKPALTKEQAKKKVSSNILVETARLAIVPIGTSTEKLCYEFMGEYDGSTYYVYIDANTGKQVEMFKVIESTEGTLLM